MIKRVLILAYDFPPYVSVGGLRPYCWYKYFGDNGIEPIVITRQWDNKHGNALDYISPSSSDKVLIENTKYGTLIRTPFFPSVSNKLLLKYGENRFRFLRKVLTAIDEVRQFITIAGPKKQIFKAADEYLKNNKVDIIITSAEPFVLFYYAKKLSQRYDIPWVADYRDTWSQDKNRNRVVFLKYWNRYLERKIVDSCVSVITVSEFIKTQLSDNITNKDLHIVLNGFDWKINKNKQNVDQNTERLTFAFMGTIYDWHPWRQFVEIISGVILEKGVVVQCNFYGINKSKEVQQLIDTYPDNVRECFSIYPKMQNAELLPKLSKENVMILFNDYSVLGTKIFDYLAINRKILLCFSDDEKANRLKEQNYNLMEYSSISNSLQADVIRETQSGIVVKNETHLKQIIYDLLEEFQREGKIQNNSVGIEQYSRESQVKKLANIIQQIWLEEHNKVK